MTIEFKSVSQTMLNDLIGCVEQTLAETETSNDIMAVSYTHLTLPTILLV